MRYPDLIFPATDHPLREPEPNEAMLLVYPDEQSTLRDLMEEQDGVELIERQQPGIDAGEPWLIKCEDEWVAQGLKRAWVS